jgi:dihydrofolate synthase/folylpolyglutamate synthase
MRFATLQDWLSWQETLHPNVIDLGLDRVRAVQQRMGLQRVAFPLITVGGTNGKGSTVAMIEAMLRAAGYRVGAYTSPHLLRYNERVRVHGAEVSDAELCAAFQRVDDARGDVSLTYFEFGTLAAMDIFARASLDAAVLEVGLGGRLDAVNVWDADVAVVTSVALDHTEWLGSDRESIAFEKAGIFRAGKPAVFGERDVPRRLSEHARDVGARLLRIGADFDFHSHGQSWTWSGPARQRPALPLPALRGPHQLANAAVALMALDALHERLPLSVAQIRDGLTHVQLAGRFQVVPGPVTRVFDVAHNPHGAHALAATLREHPSGGRTLAVCGMLRDKDITATLREMTARVDAWYVAPVASPRSADAAQIERALQQADNRAPVHAFDDVRSAYAAAVRDARPGDRVLVFGSFYTVAAAI